MAWLATNNISCEIHDQVSKRYKIHLAAGRKKVEKNLLNITQYISDKFLNGYWVLWVYPQYPYPNIRKKMEY